MSDTETERPTPEELRSILDDYSKAPYPYTDLGKAADLVHALQMGSTSNEQELRRLIIEFIDTSKHSEN